MTSRSSSAQSSFTRSPFAERFSIASLACWHWAALARTAHSSPAIPAQTPCTSLESCFSAFICTAVHFAGQSERRVVPAKVQQLLPAIHDNYSMQYIIQTNYFCIEGVVVLAAWQLKAAAAPEGGKRLLTTLAWTSATTCETSHRPTTSPSSLGVASEVVSCRPNKRRWADFTEAQAEVTVS